MNKVILMGRLTKDPELKYTQSSNIAVCTFTLAVNRKFAKEGTPQADFIRIVTWRHTAEFCAKWFRKGKQVAICGSIQTRTWDDPEGKRHYETEVVADDCYFADSKRDGDGQGGSPYGGGYTAPMTPPPEYGGAGGGFGGESSSGVGSSSGGIDAGPGGESTGSSGSADPGKETSDANGDGFYPLDDDQLPF